MCINSKPTYLPHSEGGIITAISRGDGYIVAISWNQAYPDTLNYQVAYNIYYSTIESDVFSEGIKFVSISPTMFITEIVDLHPGEVFYFAVRATEFDPSWYNLSLLPDSGSSKIYPEALLLQDLSPTSTYISITDLVDFPSYGVVQVGFELIQYTNKDIPSNSLTGLTRGFLGTNITEHLIDGYDGYRFEDPLVHFWKGLEEGNRVIIEEMSRFVYPNFARTDADGYKTVLKDILTTDLGATEASQQNFPIYDYAGWHRTDPVALLRGDCLGTYYGGQQYCADGYDGVGRVIRGISIQEINNQRQEILLNLTGEPCCLFRRMRTGIRCSCFLSNNEYPEDRCPVCFPPGTLIRTENGYKTIETIKIGEKVLTADGSFQKVLRLFENDYKGKLHSITSNINTNPILATPEHPFLVMKGTHNSKIKRKCSPKCNHYMNTFKEQNADVQQLPSGNWWARTTINSKRTSLGAFATKIEAINVIDKIRNESRNQEHYLNWESAKNIEKNNWLVSKYNKEIKDIKEINIPLKYLKNTNLGEKRLGVEKFIVDEEFLWIIGIYLAEGCNGTRSINFSLHEKEIEYQERICRFFKKYGYNPKIRHAKNNKGVAVEVYSTTLAQWFPNWLGKHCNNKKIPEEFMYLPPNKAWAIINGVYDGDGSKREHEICQTSEILALQLTELLHRVDEQPLIRKVKNNILTLKGNKKKQAYIVNWSEDTFLNHNRKGRWDFNNELLTKVKNVSEMDYEGKVYNLEVEGTHTYVVQNIVVHNCNGSGFVIGYEQFFNPRRSDGRIMVRFDPTKDDLRQDESGLESVFLPNCRTLVVPGIKDRDFIIRFNEDDTEEFRYEILDVTRNKLLIDALGAQQFSVQRVRKTDPIYQVGAFRNTSTMPQTISTTLGMVPGPGGIVPHLHNVQISEKIVSLSQINQTTSVSQFHNHAIISGIVQPILGHSHIIIL